MGGLQETKYKIIVTERGGSNKTPSKVGQSYFTSIIGSKKVLYETLLMPIANQSVATCTHLEVLHEAVASMKDLEKVLAGLSIGGVHHSSQWGSGHRVKRTAPLVEK